MAKTTYKKLSSLKPAIEKCDAVKLVYVGSNNYYVITLDDYKVFQLLGITPKAIHPEFAGCHGGHKHHKIVGYRVSNEVGEIVRANQQMINDIARYL
jgi:hypothetical protein